ncbi:MAG TPA: aminopeptidase [Cyanobacteria bacterium UBA11149]|nr:aminopeptidase [Cyanobacteria bacterium UBA11367]HBE57372.1 aminopeptidase [Cyanobacteria bacterium UBA11366]HBK65680.1 aminopeptidase [Cyanobacteria bacterium UBA11166]HBR74791.1 aminopeptidase [Cyanobacteria bacterium UBA11159]HBS70686.1 aminopeptidase [Cyanobacteria bacterium UBA11153]HBW91556.1 aminopeptidase [Cyanobacteria bacterium UBA11149]HCA94882.1 aminopeptidase [Cyanobacteria bacterium UBA9226]
MSHSYSDSDNNSHKSFELPGAKPHYNPDRPGQVKHIFLDLVLNIPHQSFGGTCSITLMPVRSNIDRLVLDAVNLNIESVKVDNTLQPFDYDGEKLAIELLKPTEIGKEIKIAIAYHVEKPQRGLYFITPDQYYPSKPTQVWTQGEDEDSRFWFPCFDYPGQLATSEICVKVPKPLMAISNGELIATAEDGDSTIYHWLQSQVHPTYLMTLAVGDFAEIRDEWQGKPVTYYVEKGREDDGKRSMGKTPQMMEFFSQKFGYPYPFPKYAQVCVDDFIFGGMENTSTTLLTDRCLLDERAALDNRNTESLVAHELAHQWFGDLVVIKHWSHAWIKEGMASYTEVLWTESEYGKDDAAYYLLGEARNYLEEDASRYRRPIVTHIYREAIELYDRHLYEKGACVYHIIRTELGDELFWKAIQTFVQDNAHKTVETIDLIRAIEKATGRNLLFIFDQYVFRGGHPDYKIAYSWDGDSNLAKITVTQTQANGNKNGSRSELFDLKIPIAFGYVEEVRDDALEVKNENESSNLSLKTFTVRIHEKEQSFYFPLEKKPQFISFDKGNNYLKTISLEYPTPELKAQLKFDPDPISRIYAAQALAKKGGLEIVKTLSEALTKDPFWGVRIEIAKQLAKIKLDQAVTALLTGLQDENPRVRRASVESLSKIKTTESYQALKELLQKGDRSYYVEASAARVIGKMASGILKDKEDEVCQLLMKILQERKGWNEVVRSGAMVGLSQIKSSPIALDEIVDYTRQGIPQPLRLTAIRALGTISIGQTPHNTDWILEQLEELSAETFFLTQMAVVGALSQMETAKAISLLRGIAQQTPDGRVRRRAEEAIQSVQKNIGADEAVKQLREELDQIKKENQELKSRLENMEAKVK